MTRTTLVIGGSAAAREAEIARLLQTAASEGPVAVILEGLADGIGRLGAASASASASVSTPLPLSCAVPLPPAMCRPLAADLPPPLVVRIAAACPCCAGNLVLRVTLNRILRVPPAALYLALSSTAHLPQLKQFLTRAPYDAILQLQAEIDLSASPSSPEQSPL
jgi:hypothetical protein